MPLPRNDAGEIPAVDLSRAHIPGKLPPARTSAKEFFESADGLLSAGVFDASPGTLALRNYPRNEIDYVVSGDLEIHDSSTGITHKFVPGDHFVTPKGFNGQWHSNSGVRVYYIVTPVAE